MRSSGHLPRAFSLYLDGVRFLAAVAVLLDHLTSFPFTGIHDGPRHGILLIGNYGTSAVTVFFVLSGFVIAYVTTQRETDLRSFVVSRASRLYSVVIPALVLTFLFDSAGQALRPEFYAWPKILGHGPTLAGYLSSCLFLNEYHVFHFGGIAPGSNGPFWSLSFEATYYAGAALLLFTSRTWAIPLTLLLLFCAGPTIAVLAPVWIMGFAAFRLGEVRLRTSALVFIVVVSAALVLIAPLLLHPITGRSFGMSFRWGRGLIERDLGKDYVTAVAMTVHLVASRSLLARWPHCLDHARRPLRALGASTFPLYAMHFPTLAFAAAISPFAHNGPLHVLWLCLFTAALVGVATPGCDWLKIRLRMLGDLGRPSAGGPVASPNSQSTEELLHVGALSPAAQGSLQPPNSTCR